MFQGVGGFRGMFVADLGGEVAMGLRRLPTLANHCAQRASFALLQGKWIELRELTYIGQIAYLIGMRLRIGFSHESAIADRSSRLR